MPRQVSIVAALPAVAVLLGLAAMNTLDPDPRLPTFEYATHPRILVLSRVAAAADAALALALVGRALFARPSGAFGVGAIVVPLLVAVSAMAVEAVAPPYAGELADKLPFGMVNAGVCGTAVLLASVALASWPRALELRAAVNRDPSNAPARG